MKKTHALPIKYCKGQPKFVRSFRPSGKHPGWDKLIDLGTLSDSNPGKVASEFGKEFLLIA
eukprot:2218836-Karenia_brevis.AAC.1